ncbi:MFS transporter [Paraburkholderia sp. JHI869]|uniref:MFS transporter n=1 Tax=Paraburkholderia sp. JHI869 TaxID=3112959 RepID=UPI00319E21A1
MLSLEQRAVGKAARHLVPLIVICFFVAYLDRTNIGIAALQMNKDLGMTASMFGFGAGLFFLMYFIMEVPSNLLMMRYGPRRWIARVLLSWGIVAGGMAFVKGPISFYIMRALLGMAEAGFYPAVLFYLTQWFPPAYRARVIGYLNVAGPLAFLIGAPISSSLLGFDGLLNLRGWQWLFIIEALPAIFLAGVVLKRLPDRPSEAKWLAPEERNWLDQQLVNEERERKAIRDYTVMQAMLSPTVYILGFVMFSVVLNVYSVGFFLPQIVKAFGLTYSQTGLLSAVPFIAGSVGILWMARRSDVKGERRWHTAAPLFLAAIGLVAAALAQNLEIKILAFSVVAFGAYGCVSAFWTLPSTFLTGAAMASGIAVINSIGALGGFAGPWLMGIVKDATGSFSGGLLCLAIVDVLAVAAVLSLPKSSSHDASEDAWGSGVKRTR